MQCHHGNGFFRPCLSQELLLNGCAGRDMSARRGPLVVGLELQAELVVEDPEHCRANIAAGMTVSLPGAITPA
jgi:hypothetical protein